MIVHFASLIANNMFYDTNTWLAFIKGSKIKFLSVSNDSVGRIPLRWYSLFLGFDWVQWAVAILINMSHLKQISADDICNVLRHHTMIYSLLALLKHLKCFQSMQVELLFHICHLNILFINLIETQL